LQLRSEKKKRNEDPPPKEVMAADRETQIAREMTWRAPFDKQWGAKKSSNRALVVAPTVQTTIKRSRRGTKRRHKRSPKKGRQTWA
jgi:hypothetical protein